MIARVRPGGRRCSVDVENADVPDRVAAEPNELWCADFTYLRCWDGVVFFASVIDVYSRMVVGWQSADHVRTDLVLDALKMALHLRGTGADVELVHHSDAGGQYLSYDYSQTLDDHHVLASVGSVGDAYDCEQNSGRCLVSV